MDIKLKYTSIIVAIFVALFAVCHRSLPDSKAEMHTDSQGLVVTGLTYSDDYKKVYLDVDLVEDFEGNGLIEAALSDSASLHVHVHEFNFAGTQIAPGDALRLDSVENIISKEASKLNFHLSALADLTLPQEQVDQQRKALTALASIYSNDLMDVTFMLPTGLSQTYPVSKYVIDNYFKTSGGERKMLYKDIVKMRDRIRSDSLGIKSDNVALMVMSDARVYDDDNVPMDPDYFRSKALLEEVDPQFVADTLSIYYVNFPSATVPSDPEAVEALKRMADSYEGIYLDTFNLSALEAHIKRNYELEYADFRITLENPDKRVFRGYPNTINVCLHDSTDTERAYCSMSYKLGSVFDPIIVNGRVTLQTVFIGLLYTLLLMLLVYVACQIVYPPIAFWLFKRKNIIAYEGPGQIVNGNIVGDKCYICKDSFHRGDEVVAACQHTMHTSCWEENDCTCPEQGKNCSASPHYYNPHRLLDRHNAWRGMKWLLMACLAAFFAWAAFLINVRILPVELLQHMVSGIFGVEATQLDPDVQLYVSQMNIIPYFGFCIGLFNMLFFSTISMSRRSWWHRWAVILGLSLFAAVGCWFFFLVECLIVVTLQITAYSVLLDWIPWTLSGLFNIWVLSKLCHTQIKKHYILIVVISSLISMSLWDIFFVTLNIDIRNVMLLSFLIYSFTIAFCFYDVNRGSERCVLQLKGNVKPIEVAVYKWFNASAKYVVTIGKSVDCDLQMTWDIIGEIAPVQAELRRIKSVLTLTPLEPGVFFGNRQLAPGRNYKLYAGSKFTIGTTTFTLLDKE